MKNTKQNIRLVTGLLFLLVICCTVYLFQAPFKQINRANPEKMKLVMSDITKEIEMLEQQHSQLPKQKEWKEALSSYVNLMDYEVYIWNKKQEGIYYANIQENHPLLLKNSLNDAILKQPTPSTSSIQMISYSKEDDLRFGYYAYIPKWKIYVSITGSNIYFESTESIMWKSIIIEILIFVFAIAVFKEVIGKVYVKPLERIVELIQKDYPIDLSNLPPETGEYEKIAEQLELQMKDRVRQSDAS